MCLISNFFKETLLHQRNRGWVHRFSKREQNFQACLNVLPNSAEFSAKILQDFYSCYEIWFELLAKVPIIGATHNNSHAYAHHGLFQKY